MPNAAARYNVILDAPFSASSGNIGLGQVAILVGAAFAVATSANRASALAGAPVVVALTSASLPAPNFQAIQMGLVPSNILSLGPGTSSPVGIDANGNAIRTTAGDPTIFAVCDAGGNVTVAPWRTASPGGIAPAGTGMVHVTGGVFDATADLGSANQVLTTNGAATDRLWSTIAGDVVGTIAALVVAAIHGATVPAAGALTTGNVLQVSGASALTYAPVNLAGGANYVTGVLPTGNQAAQTMGGDVTGTTAAATVVALQGRSVSSSAPNTGNTLGWTGAAWAPSALNLAGGANYVTGTLPVGNLPNLAGDAAGAINANTVSQASGATLIKVGFVTTHYYSEIGQWTGGDPYGAIYLGKDTTPSGTNFALIANGTSDTLLNAPAAGTVHLQIANVDELTVTTSQVTHTPGTLQWVEGATVSVLQAAHTTDVAVTDFAITSQAPWSSATTNKSSANVVLKVPNIVAGGTFGHLKVQQNSLTNFEVGPSTNSNADGTIWLGLQGTAPSGTNYTLQNSSGGNTFLNNSGGTLFLTISGNAALTVNSTTVTLYRGSTGFANITYNMATSGSSGTMAIAAAIGWTLTQTAPASDVGVTALTIQAQSAFATASTNVNGANLVLQGGAAKSNGATGLRGGVRCELGQDTAEVMVECAEVAVGQRVVSLAQLGSGITSTQVPASGGDGIVWIGAASTAPVAAGKPSGGVTLWANTAAQSTTPNAASIMSPQGVVTALAATGAGAVGGQARRRDEIEGVITTSAAGAVTVINYPTASAHNYTFVLIATARVTATGAIASLVYVCTGKNVAGTLTATANTSVVNAGDWAGSSLAIVVSGTTFLVQVTPGANDTGSTDWEIFGWVTVN